MVLYSEPLDLLRFGGPGFQEGLLRWLGAKYAGRPIDLVVAVGPSTLAVAMELRPKLWPGAPIVAMGLGRAALASIPAGSNVTGLTIDVEIDSSLDGRPRAGAGPPSARPGGGRARARRDERNDVRSSGSA